MGNVGLRNHDHERWVLDGGNADANMGRKTEIPHPRIAMHGMERVEMMDIHYGTTYPSVHAYPIH